MHASTTTTPAAHDAIRSDARPAAWATAIGALLWNALCWPAAFLAWTGEPDADAPVAALGVTGLALLGLPIARSAHRAIVRWRRFGATPLTLDPETARLGGTLRGHVLLGGIVDGAMEATATLTLLETRRRGTRSTPTTVPVWQRERRVRPDAGTDGTRLGVAFELPADLPPSTDAGVAASGDRTRHLWRLRVAAPTVGLERDFTVPIAAADGRGPGRAARPSAHASEAPAPRPAGPGRNRATAIRPGDDASDPLDPVPEVHRRIGPDGDPRGEVELRFPWTHALAADALAAGIGAAFAATSAWLFSLDGGADHAVIGTALAAFGAALLSWGAYGAASSRRVRVDARGVTVESSLCGRPWRERRLAFEAVARFRTRRSASSSGVGGRHRLWYAVLAEGMAGERLELARFVEGEERAEALARWFEARAARS